MRAYMAYLEKSHGAVNDLCNAVFQFAQGKGSNWLNDAPQHAITADDVANKAAYNVWKSLGTFKGEPDAFPSWVNRICYTAGHDALEEVEADNMGKVPLEVEHEDDPGFLSDNPLLHRQSKLTYARPLPAFIQGHDRLICDYIRDGLTYKEIGAILVMTEAAVKMRVTRMRNQVEASTVCRKTPDYLP